MNLSTSYLGLNLRTPLVPSASPLTYNPDNVKRMEDAGASAIVFHSLFEEQIRADERDNFHYLTQGTDSYAESLTYFPDAHAAKVGPEQYLESLARAKRSVKIPVIGSLNGSTPGGWTSYAKLIQETGVDALELNLYSIHTDFDRTSEEIENEYLEIVREIKSIVKIPIAVKLGPYFTNFGRMAKRLQDAGASGLVLFNRFYQPDIDTETMDITPNILLSTPMAMRLPLTWIGILSGRLPLSLAATSGIHRATDVIRMIMVGADVTMLCSILLRRGISHLGLIENDLFRWLSDHEYDSLEQLKGSVSQSRCPDPTAYERSLYVYSLRSTADRYSGTT